jgi:hypothetical protein
MNLRRAPGPWKTYLVPAMDPLGLPPLGPVAQSALGPSRPPIPAAEGLDQTLDNALRFGAGVGAPGVPPPPWANLAPVLVRDAATVPRQRGLQAHAGSPGPEAFHHPRAPAAARRYGSAPGLEPGGRLDLLV